MRQMNCKNTLEKCPFHNLLEIAISRGRRAKTVGRQKNVLHELIIAIHRLISAINIKSYFLTYLSVYSLREIRVSLYTDLYLN